MVQRTVFCVGFDLPGDDFEYVSFESNRSLLDADIILFEPTLGDFGISSEYNGKPWITEADSARIPTRLAHWRSELIAAVNAGKLVIIFLAAPVEVYRYTGRKEYSGTGRNRHVTHILELLTSYSAVPNIDRVVAAEGSGITISPQAAFLSSYWKELGTQAKYAVYIEGQFSQVLLQTKAAARTVGALFRGKGNLMFLPPVRYPTDRFLKWNRDETEQRWTTEAVKFGKRFSAIIVGIADSLARGIAVTPPPEWSRDSQYQLRKERELAEKIAVVDQKVASLQTSREQLSNELAAVGRLRALLYEQGRQLEAGIIDALRAMGFTASSYKEAQSEFDVVFSSPEGRFLGEAEGKDTKPINIDKLSQLERNLQEDFQREEVTEFAKGVLFGNAHRLMPPAERGEWFTAKCISGARRANIALVRTVDLFAPARYLKEHDDPEYAAACRQALFQADGKMVEFPVPPDASPPATPESEGP
jgi:hypothetical protein